MQRIWVLVSIAMLVVTMLIGPGQVLAQDGGGRPGPTCHGKC